MLYLQRIALSVGDMAALAASQSLVDAPAAYADRVNVAKSLWGGKVNTIAGKALFTTIRKRLAEMCTGSVRCVYCEDSMADEIEHILPKDFFPGDCFKWVNMAFACGPCNGPKGSRYASWNGTNLVEAIRKRKGPVLPPAAGPAGLIDPTQEDPTAFIELDLGGVAQGGSQLIGTFFFLPKNGLSPLDSARASHTIKILRLNRDVLWRSRKNAFGGFRARLREYVEVKEAGASVGELQVKKDDLLKAPHLSVFFEMRRQRAHLPEVDDFLNRAPEAALWPLT